MDEFRIHDVLGAKREAQKGIDRAHDHADTRWKTAAYLAVSRVALERETFTATDIWLVLGAMPAEPRALAKVIQRAAKNELIEPTDRYRPSGTRRNHNRPERVWRSKIHKGDR